VGSSATIKALKTLIIVAFIVASTLRFAGLDKDPPVWMSADYITDEGWWADGARGKVYFDDYFADDVGIAYMMTPAYTWLLEGIYRLAGVGLVQTRMLAVLSSTALVTIIFWGLRRALGLRVSMFAAMLLAISPFYWAYSRVAFVEGLQSLVLFLSLLLLIDDRLRIHRALLSGILLGLAVAVKPNTLTLGVPAYMAAGLVVLLQHRTTSSVRRRGLFVFSIFVGVVSVGALIVAVVALPDLERYTEIALRESGGASLSIDSRLLLSLARAFVNTASVGGVESLSIWTPLLRSPLILFLCWTYTLWFLARRSAPRVSPTKDHTLPIAVFGWCLVMLLSVLLQDHQPDRRFVLLLPGLSVLGGIAISVASKTLVNKNMRTQAPSVEIAANFSLGRRILFLALLTLPLVILLKPHATTSISRWSEAIPLGAEPGIGYGGAAASLVLLWIGGLLILSARPHVAATTSRVVRRAWPKTLLILGSLLFVTEMTMIGHVFFTASDRFSEEQRQLRVHVHPKDVIVGDAAASLFMPYPVRTVRYEVAEPPLNPDMFERLSPDMVVEMTRRDFVPIENRYDFATDKHDSTLARVLQIGPVRGGVSRFEFMLFRLRD
jgi:4-amino-4-deoxy-L-arabinose transferase-like glycosyltransferase